MANFDLHLHPSSKSYLSDENENKRITPWDLVRGFLLQLFEPILKSQANFTQLHKGNVKLAVYPIVPMEKGFSNNWLIRSFVVAFTVLDKSFLTEINFEVYSYSDLFWKELAHVKKNLKNKETGQEVKLLYSIEDFDDTNQNLINGILSIEGSHALKHRNGDYMYFENLAKIKNRKDVSFLYLTLTHLTWNDLCNHAFGSKISKSRIFWPHPDVKGISTAGLEIIKECYSTTNGKRILIDIKHMSAVARKQFFKFRKENGFSDIPILATHMGLTGFALKELKSKFVDQPNKLVDHPDYVCTGYIDIKGIGEGKKDETHFNPWSINLYDEEIIEIIDSDGLIGISLDERILGFGKKNEEFFRTDELCELAGIAPDELDHGEPCDESDEPRSGRFGRRRKHLRYLCNNLLHAARVGGPKAWEHICLGSDFDGLINAINNCKTVEDYPQLEGELVEMLGVMSQELPEADFHITDLKAHVRGFMFENGKRFLEKYFTKTYLETGVVAV